MTSGNIVDLIQGYCSKCKLWTSPQTMVAFGTWDAPMTDEAFWLDHVPTELGLKCMYCDTEFLEGDNGAIMPTMHAQHRECGYRGVMGGIGHHVDHEFFCRSEYGPDAGMSKRASALLVWQMMVEKQPPFPTRETLLMLVGRGSDG